MPKYCAYSGPVFLDTNRQVASVAVETPQLVLRQFKNFQHSQLRIHYGLSLPKIISKMLWIDEVIIIIIIIFICSEDTINDAQQRANDKTWTGQQGGKATLTAARE